MGNSTTVCINDNSRGYITQVSEADSRSSGAGDERADGTHGSGSVGPTSCSHSFVI